VKWAVSGRFRRPILTRSRVNDVTEPSPLKLFCGRALTSLYRFRTAQRAERLFRGAKETSVVSRPFFGRTLYLDVGRGNPQRLLFLEGERFVEERLIIRQLVKPRVGALDVGANIGYYSLMLAEYVGSAGEVTCIEPEPTNLIELRRNISKNRLERVRVVEAAAGDHSGTVMLLPGINGRVQGLSEGGVSVPVITVDSLDLDRLGFIKIDVEGYELPVLKGATGTLDRYRPNLFVEVHPQLQDDPRDTAALVQLLKFYYRELRAFTKNPRSMRNRTLGRYFPSSVYDVRLTSELVDSFNDTFWIACSSET
jgi:FkbM family methyltransferase